MEEPEWRWTDAVQAGYLRIEPEGDAHRTVTREYLNATINLDLDKNHQIIGIEVLG